MSSSLTFSCCCSGKLNYAVIKKISNCFLGLIDFFIEITMRISLEEDSALPTVGSQDT